MSEQRSGGIAASASGPGAPERSHPSTAARAASSASGLRDLKPDPDPSRGYIASRHSSSMSWRCSRSTGAEASEPASDIAINDGRRREGVATEARRAGPNELGGGRRRGVVARTAAGENERLGTRRDDD